jgi:DNA-directed RNA polymerase specialized sigma24 family protein
MPENRETRRIDVRRISTMRPYPYWLIRDLDLRAAVRSLPEPLRTTTRLALSGYTQEEISSAYGIVRTAVTHRLKKAHRLLRRALVGR